MHGFGNGNRLRVVVIQVRFVSRRNFPSHTAMNTGTGRRYYERDHAEIIGTLKDYAAHWRAIGAALGFKEGELDNIQANLVLLTQSPPLSYLRQMVSQWLQWAPRDGRGSTGFATEESLHVALLKANLGAGLAVQGTFASILSEIVHVRYLKGLAHPTPPPPQNFICFFDPLHN